MSFDDTLNENFQREIDAIISDARSRAAGISTAAKTDAEKITADGIRTTDKECSRQRTIALSGFKSLQLAEKGRAFESIINKLRENTYLKLREHWQNNFSDTAAEISIYGARSTGAQEIDAVFTTESKEQFVQNEKRIRSALTDANITLRNVSFDLRAEGGAVIISADGRRMRTETFEECFRRIEDSVRIECAQRIGYGQYN